MDESFIDFEPADVKRHWNSESEKFAGGDAVASMMNAGWRLKAVLSREHRQLSGTRQVLIYHIELDRDGQRRQLRVVCNPYITRLLAWHGLQVDQTVS
jgi:hypothetical protein